MVDKRDYSDFEMSDEDARTAGTGPNSQNNSEKSEVKRSKVESAEVLDEKVAQLVETIRTEMSWVLTMLSTTAKNAEELHYYRLENFLKYLDRFDGDVALLAVHLEDLLPLGLAEEKQHIILDALDEYAKAFRVHNKKASISLEAALTVYRKQQNLYRVQKDNASIINELSREESFPKDGEEDSNTTNSSEKEQKSENGPVEVESVEELTPEELVKRINDIVQSLKENGEEQFNVALALVYEELRYKSGNIPGIKDAFLKKMEKQYSKEEALKFLDVLEELIHTQYTTRESAVDIALQTLDSWMTIGGTYSSNADSSIQKSSPENSGGSTMNNTIDADFEVIEDEDDETDEDADNAEDDKTNEDADDAEDDDDEDDADSSFNTMNGLGERIYRGDREHVESFQGSTIQERVIGKEFKDINQLFIVLNSDEACITTYSHETKLLDVKWSLKAHKFLGIATPYSDLSMRAKAALSVIGAIPPVNAKFLKGGLWGYIGMGQPDNGVAEQLQEFISELDNRGRSHTRNMSDEDLKNEMKHFLNEQPGAYAENADLKALAIKGIEAISNGESLSLEDVYTNTLTSLISDTSKVKAVGDEASKLFGNRITTKEPYNQTVLRENLEALKKGDAEGLVESEEKKSKLKKTIRSLEPTVKAAEDALKDAKQAVSDLKKEIKSLSDSLVTLDKDKDLKGITKLIQVKEAEKVQAEQKVQQVENDQVSRINAAYVSVGLSRGTGSTLHEVLSVFRQQKDELEDVNDKLEGAESVVQKRAAALLEALDQAQTVPEDKLELQKKFKQFAQRYKEIYSERMLLDTSLMHSTNQMNHINELFEAERMVKRALEEIMGELNVNPATFYRTLDQSASKEKARGVYTFLEEAQRTYNVLRNNNFEDATDRQAAEQQYESYAEYCRRNRETIQLMLQDNLPESRANAEAKVWFLHQFSDFCVQYRDETFESMGESDLSKMADYHEKMGRLHNGLLYGASAKYDLKNNRITSPLVRHRHAISKALDGVAKWSGFEALGRGTGVAVTGGLGYVGKAASFLTGGLAEYGSKYLLEKPGEHFAGWIENNGFKPLYIFWPVAKTLQYGGWALSKTGEKTRTEVSGKLLSRENISKANKISASTVGAVSKHGANWTISGTNMINDWDMERQAFKKRTGRDIVGFPWKNLHKAHMTTFMAWGGTYAGLKAHGYVGDNDSRHIDLKEVRDELGDYGKSVASQLEKEKRKKSAFLFRNSTKKEAQSSSSESEAA